MMELGADTQRWLVMFNTDREARDILTRNWGKNIMWIGTQRDQGSRCSALIDDTQIQIVFRSILNIRNGGLRGVEFTSWINQATDLTVDEITHIRSRCGRFPADLPTHPADWTEFRLYWRDQIKEFLEL